MSERIHQKPGITDHIAARRKHKDRFLGEIVHLINSKPLEKVLRQKLNWVANAGGNPTYPLLLMFKILLLQHWNTLSDMAMVAASCDRLPFVRFMDLSLDHDEVPDSTAICRFKNLVECNILKRLLDKLNHQLECPGLLVCEGIFVDASAISPTRRLIKVLDVLPEGREKNSGDAPDVTISYFDDAYEAWLRKGNRAYYGFKIHTAMDSRDGFVLGGHATPANRSDTEEFVTVLGEIDVRTGESIYADRGYSSQLTRYVRRVRGLSDGIMHKAARNRELTLAEKAANRQVSRVRSKVERAFGTLKHGYGFFRARYLGLTKVELEFRPNALAFNLKTAEIKGCC